jgi:hypothetical protein
MPNSSKNSSRTLTDPVLDLLWRQWSALGVAGHARDAGSAAVDPEALLLVSTVFARHDARLFDEILDWLHVNGAWINVQRLTRLQRELGIGEPTVLSAIADHLGSDSAHRKWKVLRQPSGSGRSARRLLFPHLAAPKTPDAVFQRWGWIRPQFEKRGLSSFPAEHQPATFLLQLRALFGRQSRAEVIAWLLAHDSGHPAQIARETGYMRASLQIVLNELASSGHVKVVRHGREKMFAALRDHWRFLVVWDPDGPFPRWVPWATVFALIRGVHDLLANPDFESYSEQLRRIEMNRVTNPLAARLAQEGWPMVLGATSTDTVAQWTAELTRLLAEFER